MPGDHLTGVCQSRRSACLYRTAVPVHAIEAAAPAAISVVTGVMTRLYLVMTGRHMPLMGVITQLSWP